MRDNFPEKGLGRYPLTKQSSKCWVKTKKQTLQEMLKSAEAKREYIYKVRKDKQVSNMNRGRIMLRVNCLPLDREYQLAPLVMPSLKKSPQFQPKCIQL